MLKKITGFWLSVNGRVFTGALALSAVLLPALVFAEGASPQTIELDEAISNINIASGLTSVGEKVATGLCLGIGLAASIWAIQLVWRKIRSSVR
ncbi:MAG: hypothetical protein IJQ31_10915 [Thermoguttaceae bacterium]|nr:hypothetical protein [Thermoguttaceae bacterium]